MSAVYPTVSLCVYGFFSSSRPSEPFLTAYSMGPDQNSTETQVVNEIYPVWTYSYLALSFPVFSATDYLRYKPVSSLQACSSSSTYAVLWKARGSSAMQSSEFFFGSATASEVAYYSYIYSVVEPELYQKATGCCRSAASFGSAAGSSLGQSSSSSAGAESVHSVVVTSASAAVAFVAPWLLPMPQRSSFFHASRGGGEEAAASGDADKAEDSESRASMISRSSEAAGGSSGSAQVLRMLLADLVQVYRCRPSSAWSVWWASATCGYFHIINYAQASWEELRPSTGHQIYNGYVETSSTSLGASAASSVGCSPVCWERWGESVSWVSSSLMAVCVFTMASSKDIWVCYSSYVVFRAVYMSLITVATYQIAASLSMQRYASVFGVNTFGASSLWTSITVVVVDSAGSGSDVVTQFLIYGGYFTVVSSVFSSAGLYRVFSSRCRKEEANGAPGAPPNGAVAH